jgi:hypothetical protein
VGVDAFAVLPHLPPGDAECIERHRTAAAVTDFSESIGSRLQEHDRRVELSQLPLGDAEVGHRAGCVLMITGVLENGQRGGSDGGPVGEVAALLQEPSQAEGEAGRRGSSPGLVSGGDGGDQVGPLVLQPLQRRPAASEERGGRPAGIGGEVRVRGARPGPVALKKPETGRDLLLATLLLEMIGGVEADQIVHAPAPPYRPRGLDQMGAVQILEDLLGGEDINVAESSSALC